MHVFLWTGGVEVAPKIKDKEGVTVGMQGWQIHVTLQPTADQLRQVNDALFLKILQAKKWPYRVRSNIETYCNEASSNRGYGKFITIYPQQDDVSENRVEQVARACVDIDQARIPGKIIQPAENQRPTGDWRLDRNLSTWISIRFGVFWGANNVGVYDYASGNQSDDDWKQPYPAFLRQEAEMLQAQLKVHGLTVKH